MENLMLLMIHDLSNQISIAPELIAMADSTVVDSTVVDSTVVDSTVVDSTVVDSTVVDSTVVDTSTQKIKLKLKTPIEQIKAQSLTTTNTMSTWKIITPLTSGTQFFPSVFTKEEATNIYQYIHDEIKWENGIYSAYSKQTTRLAKSLSFDDNDLIKWAMTEAIKRMKIVNYIIYGLYLNYYRDGNDFAPSHSHKETTQLILSFNEEGGDRTLKIASKSYPLNNGDCILFGSSTHGVPKESNKKGRISIAIFMKEAPELKGQIAYLSS
jgi:hypothetical protein